LLIATTRGGAWQWCEGEKKRQRAKDKAGRSAAASDAAAAAPWSLSKQAAACSVH